jgi:double-stranded uracil-DNA glycosylase
VGASRAPDEEALQDAVACGAVVPDVIASGLDVLFCGINPGRWSGAVGHHFAHPGNRFWKALQQSGFTVELLRPEQERRLLDERLGITNLVARTTARADDLSGAELRAGKSALEGKIRRYSPKAVAFLGLGAYRHAFGRPAAVPGRQQEDFAGSAVWVLPNPSGLQARYGLSFLVDELRELRLATSGSSGDAAS